MYYKHGIFDMFGHGCDLSTELRQYSIYKIQKSKWKSFWNMLARLRIISPKNRLAYMHLRSQRKFIEEMDHHMEAIHLIHPFSIFKKYWDIIMATVLFLQFFINPFLAAIIYMDYPYSYLAFVLEVIQLVLNIIATFDIILNFFTGYYDDKNGKTVMRQSKIIRKYLFTYFLLDFFTGNCGTLLQNILNDYFRLFLLFVQFLRIARYGTFLKLCNNIQNNFNIAFFRFRCAMAVINIIFFLHYICCIDMLLISTLAPYQVQYRHTEAHTQNYGERIENVIDIYGRFLYGACLLVTNSGYGISSVNNISRIYVCVVWLLSKLLNIYYLAYFIDLYNSNNSSTQTYVDIRDEITEFVQDRQIPESLRKRIFVYYNVKYKEKYFNEFAIFGTISNQLKQEILMTKCRKLVESVHFFKELPIPLLVRIVSCLKLEIYLVNDLIAKAGSHGDFMYFIGSGSVAVFTKFGKEICHLGDGDHFGEIALIIPNTERVASVVAIEVTELYKLSRKDFMKAILPYPDLFEKIQNVAVERMETTQVLEETTKATEKTEITFSK